MNGLHLDGSQFLCSNRRASPSLAILVRPCHAVRTLAAANEIEHIFNQPRHALGIAESPITAHATMFVRRHQTRSISTFARAHVVLPSIASRHHLTTKLSCLFLLAAVLSCAQPTYTITALTCESKTIAPGESKQCTGTISWTGTQSASAVVQLGGMTWDFGLLVQLIPYTCMGPLICNPSKLSVPAGTTTVTFTVSYPAAGATP